MVCGPATLFAAAMADRKVTNPLPAPPVITPLALLTLMPAPVIGKSLVEVTLYTFANTGIASISSTAVNRKRIFFLINKLLAMVVETFKLTTFHCFFEKQSH